MKRIIAALLILMLSAMMLPTVAAEELIEIPQESPERYMDWYTLDTLDGLVDYDEFYAYLREQVMACKTEISVEKYNLPDTQAVRDVVFGMFRYEIPEAFHIAYVNIITSGGKITHARPIFEFDPSEYQTHYNACVAARDKLLKGIKGNDNLSQMEKALLIHDRLALLGEYDHTHNQMYSYGMYGILVRGTGVCQSYTEAYDFLLQEVGIESRGCITETLNHIWNIITIDGVEYHVDVTWDDPTSETNAWNVKGFVYHRYFLNSSTMAAQRHDNVKDIDTKPGDTRYDGQFDYTEAAFYLIDDTIFCVNHRTRKLSTFGGSAILDLPTTWPGTSSNLSRLACVDERLFYSTHDSVMLYDTRTGTSTCVLKLNLASGYFIAGFAIEDGYIVYDVANNYNFNTAAHTREKYKLDLTPPTVQLSSTNDNTPFPTLTATFSDNGKPECFYWGRSENYLDNMSSPITENTASMVVDVPGTYYMTVRDTCGNVSETKAISFWRTTLKPNGGTVSPTYIVSEGGKTLQLPEPTLSRKGFKGWALSADAESGVTSIVPTGNATYYAIWGSLPVKALALKTPPAKLEYECGETLDKTGLSLHVIYEDNTEETITEGFTVTGYDPQKLGEQTVLVTLDGKSVSFTVTVYKAMPFTDVSEAAWYHDSIQFAFRNKLMNGMTPTTFAPDASMSRAMLVTVLYRLSGSPEVAGESPFTDVGSQWFADAVIWAAQEGIVNGMTPTTFAPDANITRAQMVTILYRYSTMKGENPVPSANLSGFADGASVPSWASDGMKWAVGEGIIGGIGNSLACDATATRAQVATILMRYMER